MMRRISGTVRAARRSERGFWPIAAAFVAALCAGAVRAHDFPTTELVDYVEVCAREGTGERQEMLYKCSCTIDRIAKELSFERFVDGITASRALSIAGERGAVMRDSEAMQALAREFRALEKKARKGCFLE